MKELKKLCTAIMICVVSVNVAAFDMNPIDVHCWGKFTCTLTDLTEKLKFPVHETMTLLAYDNYTKPESIDLGAAKKSSDNLQKKGRLRDLVIGSEWNDDPDSLLKQGITSSIQWFALFRDAESQAKCKKSPDRPECNGKKITNNPMMLYRSHFGDLQFLHSMASTDD